MLGGPRPVALPSPCTLGGGTGLDLGGFEVLGKGGWTCRRAPPRRRCRSPFTRGTGVSPQRGGPAVSPRWSSCPALSSTPPSPPQVSAGGGSRTPDPLPRPGGTPLALSLSLSVPSCWDISAVSPPLPGAVLHPRWSRLCPGGGGGRGTSPLAPVWGGWIWVVARGDTSGCREVAVVWHGVSRVGGVKWGTV